MTRYQAVFKGEVIADSSDAVLYGGRVYFPLVAVRANVLTRSKLKTLHLWRGIASYHGLVAAGVQELHAAWTYRHPSPFARKIKNLIAFDRCVDVQVAR